MLMRAEQPTDHCFPTLARALDPGEVANVLASDLALAGFAVRRLDVEIERVRLKPGRKALLGYRLTGIDTGGKAIDQRLMMTLWPNGRSSELPTVEGSAKTVPDFGPPRLDCTELGGSAWFFPNDRKIRGIARLIGQANSFGSSFEVVHYVPEQGCTLRVVDGERTLFGKARADARCNVAAGIAASAAEQDFDSVRLAKLIDHDPAMGIMWQGAVEGEPLAISLILQDPEFWSIEVAGAIAAFHRLAPSASLARLTHKAQAERLEARARSISLAFPALAPDLSILTSRLTAMAPDPGPSVLSHCDCHPANLLWNGESFALIDLDTCALAPAALDHASLAAALAQKAFAQGEAERAVWTVVRAIKSAAGEAEGVAAEDFTWQLATCLVTERLYRCGTRLKSTHPDMPRQLLGLAMRALKERFSTHG